MGGGIDTMPKPRQTLTCFSIGNDGSANDRSPAPDASSVIEDGSVTEGLWGVRETGGGGKDLNITHTLFEK